MPRTKDQNKEIKEVTVSKIKKAGLQFFLTKGLGATSVADIAGAAELSTGLMYHYYQSKEALYVELVNEAVAETNEAMNRIVESGLMPAEKVTALTMAILKQARTNELAAYFFAFMQQAMLAKNLQSKLKPALKDAYMAIDILQEIVVEGQKSGEIREGNPKAMSILFFSTMAGLCTYKVIMGSKFVFPAWKMIAGLLVDFNYHLKNNEL